MWFACATAFSLLFAAAAVVAQQPRGAGAVFDVVSIKPYERENYYSFSFQPGGGFRGTLPLEWLIGIAFDIRPFERIVGEPAWARTRFFEIEGRPAGPVSRAETQAMLRRMLEDRFGLVWRRDPTGKATVYALTMARDDRRLGPGIRPAESPCLKESTTFPPIAERRLRPGVAVPCGTASTGELFTGGGVPIGTLASSIQLASGEEVTERTGLTGTFDFYLTLPRGQNPAQDGVSIFTAVQEQLGMRLQREDIERDVFIVEKVSLPTAN